MLPSMSLKVKLTADVASTGSRSRALVLVSLGTALVLVTYVTPMATIPQTAADLGSGSGARAWILSSMSVGLAAALLASGAVGDALGRRRTYVVGLVATGVGSLLCAVATGSALFVAARVLEGVGGAAILACGLAILAHAARTPGGAGPRLRDLGRQRRARDHGRRRAGRVARHRHRLARDLRRGRRRWPLPWSSPACGCRSRPPSTRAGSTCPASSLLGAAMTLLVSGAHPGAVRAHRRRGPRGVAALVLLVVVRGRRARTAEPMLDPALLRNRGFLAATIGTLVLGVGIIGMSSNVPTLVQVELGGSLWTASGCCSCWSVTSVVTSLLVRNLRIPLSGPRLIAVALGVVAVGELLGLRA